MDTGSDDGTQDLIRNHMAGQRRPRDGLDGDYVPRDQLCISADRSIDHDLSTSLDLGRRFDLFTCLEVAEHLPAEAAETLIDSLCRHADVIVFATDEVAHEHEWPEMTGPLDMVHPELFPLCRG